MQKAGYIPGEQFAMHTRRRFRLVPAPGQVNTPQPDVSLFVVHYGPAEPNDRVPIAMIPYDERVNAIMQQRHYLQRAGQIRRKEFMLSDRVNWPNLPDPTRQQMAPQMVPRGVPQQMAYPTQPTPGPPAKRARHAASQQAAIPGMPQLDAAFDDDEDVSRGDMFDHLTPREISLSRYQQNHEWMEEILSSPYRISQITPADLGLGFKGELASLTEGIFSAQGADAFTSVPENPYIGRLDPGQADEFRKRVNEHIESTKAEIEKMQADHAEALAKFKESSILNLKEKELRSVVNGTGPEIWRVEGRVDTNDEENSVPRSRSKKSVDEIVTEVEAATGLKVDTQPDVKRVQDGGYQAPAPEPTPAPAPQLSRQPSQSGSQNSGVMIGESDIDMGGTAAGLLDQIGFSSTSTPVNTFGTPQPHLSGAQSGSGTPNLNVPSPAPQAATNPAQVGGRGDVSMGGTGGSADQTGTAPDHGTGSGDWVVIPKGGATPDPNAQASNATPSNLDGGDAKPASETPKPASNAPTPAITDGGSVSFDQNDFSSLGDLDTAGDALANFDGPTLDGSAGELGEGLDLNMDMDDSAFGDAFHGVESSGTPADGQGQDM